MRSLYCSFLIGHSEILYFEKLAHSKVLSLISPGHLRWVYFRHNILEWMIVSGLKSIKSDFLNEFVNLSSAIANASFHPMRNSGLWPVWNWKNQPHRADLEVAFCHCAYWELPWGILRNDMWDVLVRILLISVSITASRYRYYNITFVSFPVASDYFERKFWGKWLYLPLFY